MNAIEQELLALQQQQAYRQRRVLAGPQNVEVTIKGKSYLSFCSNDYLGLANHKQVCNAAKNAITEFGVGSGASQLISGYCAIHADLEEQLAHFLGYEKALLFSSGYLANLGIISTFAQRKSVVLEDRLNHASLIDAAKYAGATLKRYRHCDAKHAQEIMQQATIGSVLLVTDGVFSMEGTIAPLPALCALNNNSKGMMIVDDAHGIGVLGEHGKGSLEHQGISAEQVNLLVGTFGKSFGSSGAFVVGNRESIEYLIQKARTLIYTTAPPPALAAATRKSLEIIINEPERRKRLHDNIAYFRKSLSSTSLALQDSSTAIQTILLESNDAAINFSRALEQRGLLVVAIRPPTVPANTARLRITLCSEHTRKQIDTLVSALLETNAFTNQANMISG